MLQADRVDPAIKLDNCQVSFFVAVNEVEKKKNKVADLSWLAGY
jgi:hypothetical protein